MTRWQQLPARMSALFLRQSVPKELQTKKQTNKQTNENRRVHFTRTLDYKSSILLI